MKLPQAISRLKFLFKREVNKFAYFVFGFKYLCRCSDNIDEEYSARRVTVAAVVAQSGQTFYLTYKKRFSLLPPIGSRLCT